MKATLLAAVLALPGTVGATVAMDPPQVASPPPAHTPTHHHLFTLKYVLRVQLAHDAPPNIVMDDRTPAIVPPAAGSNGATVLGAVDWHPNVIICHDWGCENAVR